MLGGAFQKPNLPKGTLEIEGEKLYVNTPSGRRFLLQYKFINNKELPVTAKLTFSPNEEMLLVNYSGENYYFTKQNSRFVLTRVTGDLLDKNPVVNNNGLVAVFQDRSKLAPTEATNSRRLFVWDMLSKFSFEQPFRSNLHHLRFSPDGKFLVGVTIEPKNNNWGGVSQTPLVAGIKVYLWLVNHNDLLKLAEYRLGRAH